MKRYKSDYLYIICILSYIVLMVNLDEEKNCDHFDNDMVKS